MNKDTVTPIKNPRGQELQDFIGEGFYELDAKAIHKAPPRIKWSPEFKASPEKRQLEYLERFGNTMNHAAAILQAERNELLETCSRQEAQIKVLQANADQAQKTLTQQITEGNTQRQQYHGNVQRLNARIRALEARVVKLSGDNG